MSFGLVCMAFGPAELIKTMKFWVWPFGPAPVNAVVWSLFYEEAFYLLLALLFCIGMMRSASLVLAFSVCFVVVASSLKFIDAATLGMAFFLGNFMYLTRDIYTKAFNKWAIAALFLGSIWVVYQLPYNSMNRGPNTYIDLFSYGAMLLFCVTGPQLPKLKIGDLSYSLYLFHCITRGKLMSFIPLGTGLFACIMVITLPLSWLTWHLIEKPMIKLKERGPVKNLKVKNKLGRSG